MAVLLVHVSVTRFVLPRMVVTVINADAEQWNFLYDSYVARKSYKLCKGSFVVKYLGVRAPHSTIFRLKNVHSTGSFIDKNTLYKMLCQPRAYV
jgi:hypothetical protein